MNKLTLWLCAITVASVIAMSLMSKTIESLKTDLKDVQTVALAQSKQIDKLALDFKSLQKVDEERKVEREERDKSDNKMRKDAARAAIVSKKPKLVESKINASFDVFAKKLQDTSK